MIIKCSRGGKLDLSKDRLTEITGYFSEPYYVRLKDLTKKMFYLRCVRNEYKIDYVPNENGPNTVGCRQFSPKVYKQIMQAAKAAVRKTKVARKPKSKTRKVAR